MTQPQTLDAAFARELDAARAAISRGEADAAFAHLERAHVLGQRHTRRHVVVHAWMLRVGWARRDAREVFGQLTRLVAAALMSKLWVPAGNTGGANVSALRPMPVPDDLAAILASAHPRTTDGRR
jgi:hypothetical protein